MPITVRIPGPLRLLTAGQPEVQLEAENVANLIQALENEYQGFRARLCERDGTLRRFVNIYVNNEDIRFLDNLETTLKSGDLVSIIPAIAGGRCNPAHYSLELSEDSLI